MKRLALAALMLVNISLFSAEKPLRVVPMRPTPQPDNVSLTVTFPKDNQVVSSGNNINFQAQLRGFPLGTSSDFPRAKLLYTDPYGQNVRVIVDDETPFGIYISFVDSLDDNNIFYDKTLNKTIPFSLSKGEHLIRTFPVRSYGESIKQKKAFASSVFYVGGRKDTQDVNLKGPLLTYNEPFGSFPYKEGGPILLDFYISNAELSKDGYKVRLTVDGKTRRLLTMWTPYFIYGLKPGSHSIRLELLDAKDQKVPGKYNDVTKHINLEG